MAQSPAPRRASQSPSSRGPRVAMFALRWFIVIVGLSLVIAAGFVVKGWITQDRNSAPVIPPAQVCYFSAGDATTTHLDFEQSGNAAIIVGESIRRALPARAATIALATAMQESGLRNLDYGDRDSIGLFQQRPSQGWGTIEQIMDPWYSSGKFYDALVKVDGWQTGDINDVAQAVQKSGVPDGYRKHVEDAKVLASVLTGHSAAGMQCVDRTDQPADPAALTAFLTKVFGTNLTITQGSASIGSPTPSPVPTLQLKAADQVTAWAATALSMANLRAAGITSITVGSQSWAVSGSSIAKWQGTPSAGAATVEVRLRG